MTTSIFLVDDSLIVRQRLTKFLSNLDHIQIVGESEEAEDAIDRISRVKPDVVILDLQLSRGTGFEVLENIKKDRPAPIVIILTNFPYPEYQEKCLKQGADFFFDKSTAFREIPGLVAKLIRRDGEPGINEFEK
jgi:DNA-binding NarL/FixJ family response regulator